MRQQSLFVGEQYPVGVIYLNEDATPLQRHHPKWFFGSGHAAQMVLTRRMLYPVRQLRIESSLSPEAVQARLIAMTEPVNRLRWGKGDADFEGRIANGHFRLRQITTYRRALRPWIDGQIVKTNGGSRLELVMAPSLTEVCFAVAWPLICAIVVETLLWLLIPPTSSLRYFLASPLLATLGIYAIVILTYAREADRFQCHIEKIFPS